MIKSMTGYGSAKGSCQGLEISLELRSVNNRYLDCSVRLPRGFLFAEETVKARVQQHISRGKVDVYVGVDTAASDAVVVKINRTLAAGYVEAVKQLSEAFELDGTLSALALGRMPDVLSVEKQDADAEAVSAAIGEICEQALREYDQMRAREGQKLRERVYE